MSAAVPEVTFDAPVKKRKTPKRRKARTTMPEPRRAAAAAFPGLTRTACANACSADGCAISGKSYCAHPTKGGLQAADMNNPDAKKRLQNARDQIDIRLDPDRFK